MLCKMLVIRSEASGENRMKMGKMSTVIDKSSENLRKKQTRDQLTGRG